MSTERLYMDYDGPDAVLEHLDQDRPSDSGDESETHGSEDVWDLGTDYPQTMDLYTGGWSEGAAKVWEMSESLKIRPIGRRTTVKTDVYGGFPNVPAYLAGRPDAMYRVTSKATVNRPLVHLYCPIGYLGNIRAEYAFNRGAAMVAVIDALESAGCRCKVTLVRVSDMDATHTLVMRFLVKDYQNQLDVDQLIFTAAHPAMFRRIGFGLQERSPYEPVRKQTRAGYGYSADLLAEDTEEDGRVVRVMLPRLVSNGGTPETFLSQMVRALPEELQTEIAE